MDTQELSQLVHRLPRRVHLRASALVGHRVSCQRVAERLVAEYPTCDRVEVRPWTGSVIVSHDDGVLDAEALRGLLERLIEEERDEQGHPLTSMRPERMPGPTRVARVVAHAFSEINGDVRAALDQRADLGTILPVIFFGLGLTEVAVTRKMPAPAWFNLLWWSLRSFMTFNPGAVEQEGRGDVDVG